MEPSSDSKILAYVIILFGFLAGYFYSLGIEPVTNVDPLEPKYQASSLQNLRDVRIDASLLSTSAFTSLRAFGAMPVVPQNGGTTNLFQ